MNTNQRRVMVRMNTSRPIRSHPIVECTLRSRGCCLCGQEIRVGQRYHNANKRSAHLECPRRGKV